MRPCVGGEISGEGSGKSTQAHLLAERLRQSGQPVVLTREPGGTPGAEAIRDLIVTGDPDRWTPWGEACLVNAARAEHLARVIRPALARGDTVICDRYVDSTRAYQGAGKGLADADLCQLHLLACDDVWPDLTIVLTIDPALGLARAGARRGGEDRFEAHDSAFHERIAAFLAALPDTAPGRCHGVAADQDIMAIAAQVAALVAR